MKRLSIVVACSLFLAACGGGGSDDAPSGPTTYTPVLQKAGDSYYYTRTDTLNNGTTTTFLYHTQVATVSPSGSRYVNTYDKDSISIDSSLFTANNNLVFNASTDCSYSPAMFTINTPLFVGQRYTQTLKESCAITRTVNINNSTSVESYETITVSAGTFNTLKIKNTKTFTKTLSSLADIYPYTENSICWVNVVTGQAVKCNVTRSYTNAITPTTVVSYTTELTRSATGATDGFVLTGSNTGGVIPYLYLTPNHFDYFGNTGDKTYAFDTTAPVTWTMKVGTGTPTAISASQTLTNSGLSITASATGTRFTASTNGSTLTAPVSWVLRATLVSEPSKFVILLIGYEPFKPFIPTQIIPIIPIIPIK